MQRLKSHVLESEVQRPVTASSVRDRLYASYRSNQGIIDEETERIQRAPYLRHLIDQYFPNDKNAKILDIGCGSGALLHFAREAGYNSCFGVDASAEQVQVAKRMGFDGVEEGDAFSFLERAESGSFDAICSFDILEHLNKEEMLRLADEVYRTLKPAGRWIVHVPNGEGLLGSRIRYSDLTHEQAFTRDSLQQLAFATGFRSVKCFEDSPIVHGLKSGIRWLTWKTARLVLRVVYMAETGDAGRQAIFSQNLLAVLEK